jgi:3-hydroxyacyl-CoA dehydrogenase
LIWKETGFSPGLSRLIVNRILIPAINEAVFTLYHDVGSREDIDTVMKLGLNHPMGPLTLADLIGLDTCLFIMETLYDIVKSVLKNASGCQSLSISK